MQLKNCRNAAKLFPSRSCVLRPASSRRGSRRLDRAAAGLRSPLESHTSLQAQPRVADPFPSRCRQKACVFPAQRGGRGECAYHRRQSLEPDCFESLQPSFLLLDQAKFGLPDSEPDDGRVRDRHRLATERVEFMLGDAA
jgi:hypothetical protein